MKKLTKEQKRDVGALREKRDAEIDFSDMPVVLDWTGAEMGKFQRPRKKPVTMRLDADVIDWLKSSGPGYQTKANFLLRHAMLHLNAQSRSRTTARSSKSKRRR